MLCKLRALLLLALLAPLFAPASGRAASAPPAEIRILGVNPADHPNVDLIVHVRDTAGFGVRGLGAGDFAVQEGERVVAGEALRVVTSNDAPPAFSLALVLDASTLLGSRALERMRADAAALAGRLLGRRSEQVELALFVPRGGDQRQSASPYTGDRAQALADLRAVVPRAGRTDLYNTIAAAVNSSAEQAARRGVPGFVLVLSDGLDRTSIVGGGAAGADEIARRGEEERVQISAFGYGGGLGRGGGALAQVADRTGGVFLANPAAADLDGAVETLRQRASGGAYRLSYRTALPPDGAAHPLAVSVGAAGQQLSAQTEMLIPQPWNTDRTAALTMELDGSAYPDLSIIARPTNGLRRTVEQLSARDFALTIDGSPLAAPPSIERVPLDPLDPAAAQTVALVVDQGGPNAAALRGMAAPLLQAPAEVPSRVALFVPGVDLGAVRFTHDHNAVLNALNGAAGRAAPGVGSGPTLLSAIHEAARDADAARRPAYLVWFADSAVPLDQRFNALVQARNKAVTLHIVTVGPADTWLEPLARVGGGRLLVSPDAGALAGLADLIAADRAAQYRLGFRAPAPGDGRRQTIGLRVGDQQASAPLVAFVPGTSAARMPLSPPAQAGVFGLLFLALMAAAVLPRRLGDWRLRCPACGRVRRAEWGDSCLFCAQQPRSEAAPAGVPLEGFALQGAALIQEGQTPVRIEADAAAPAEPPLLERAAGQALEAPPLTTLEQARAQSHTDFWGPLPGESAPPPRRVASPAPAPLAPPPLPIFEPAEPEQRPPAAELAEPEPGYEQAHSDFWGAPAEPDEPATDLGQPAGHTDFWGPAADSQTGQGADALPRRAGGFWGPLDEPDEPDSAEQASEFWRAGEAGQTDDDTGVALPSSHTDFWGAPADKEGEGERRP